MDKEQMEAKIDELRENRDAYYEFVRSIKEKIQDEFDLASYKNILPVMDVLRRLIFFIDGQEIELIV